MTSVHIPDDVLDAENALKQCGDWTFLASLLEDVLAEKDAFITTLEATLKANEHRKFGVTAHGIKGAALNLYLTSMAKTAKAMEVTGKSLAAHENNTQPISAGEVEQLMGDRITLLDRLKNDYKKLEAFLPTAKQLAEEEEDEDEDEYEEYDEDEDE